MNAFVHKIEPRKPHSYDEARYRPVKPREWKEFQDACEGWAMRYPDWNKPLPDAKFSCNSTGQIWLKDTNNYSIPEERVCFVEGESKLLDQIVNIFLTIRSIGGVIFINKRGAYYKTATDFIYIVKFNETW